MAVAVLMLTVLALVLVIEFAERSARFAGRELVYLSARLLDHLVSGGQQRFRDGEAEYPPWRKVAISIL
jgi:hypothetical protein